MFAARATAIKSREVANDVFYTPHNLVNIHVEMVKNYVKEDDNILDPFYGDGRYYDAYSTYYPNNKKDFTEIQLGRDFFEYDKPAEVIISNPPYSLLDKVLEKCVSLNSRVISFLISQHNLTPKRMEYMASKGYKVAGFFMTKVKEWFGFSIIITFVKDENLKDCITYDRKVYSNEVPTEGNKVRKCSVCREVGHFKNKCPNKK